VDATSRDTKVTRRLDKNQATYSKRYLNLVQAYSTYEKFSNKAWMLDIKNPGRSYDSLESLHDAVHGLIGNGAHFTYVSGLRLISPVPGSISCLRRSII